jgi:hypothetical protein
MTRVIARACHGLFSEDCSFSSGTKACERVYAPLIASKIELNSPLGIKSVAQRGLLVSVSRFCMNICGTSHH